ncbi:MAG: GEVED domain-containing protein [Bacteroidota bacterium]
MKNYLPLKTLFQKSRTFALMFLITISLIPNSLKAQVYCETNLYTTGCTDSDLISYVELNTLINNSGASCSNTSPYIGYNDFTSLPTTSLTPGQSYQSVIGNIYGSAGVSLWIDLNDDGYFNTLEQVGYASNLPANSNYTTTVNIPLTGNSGIHRMRVRLVYNEPGSTIDPCTQYNYGECEDYSVYIEPLPPCSGTPYAGNTVSTSTLICANSSFNLDLVGNTVESGITYQWQSTPDGTIWSNVGTPQTNWTKTINNLSATLMYRCITTCTISTLSDTSTNISVNLNPLINCYCLPEYSWDCNGDRFIDFSVANIIAQPVNCGSGGFTDSTMSTNTIINLTAGNQYTLTVNTGSSFTAGDAASGVWVDFNENGVFDASEFTTLGVGSAGTYSIPLYVPITSQGSVRMRLKLDANSATSSTYLDACTNNNFSNYGQIVDYKVNITPAPTCTSSPNAGDATSDATAVCENVSYTLDLSNNSQASSISYQWQSSQNGTSWTNLGIAQNTIPYSINTQSTTTYYRCVTTCTTSALSATSTPVVVTQNLATNCYCFPEMTYCSSVGIYSVSFANLNYTTTCNNTDGYTNYVDSILAINLNAGQTYSLLAAVTTLSASPDGQVTAWIDYNQNGIFENTEMISVGAYTTGAVSQLVNVPIDAIGGNTRMRIKLETSSSVYIPDPCTAFSSNGQTLDYLVNITPAPACTGAPFAGNAVSTFTSVCENVTLKLNLENNDLVKDMLYQWQYSNDNTTWFNTGTAQSYAPYAITSQSVTTFYRCITTCTNSSQTSTSTPVTVLQNPYTACYCIPPPMNCSGSDAINYVAFATMTNTSACSVNGYEDYTSSVPTTSVNAGQSYTLTTVLGYMYNENVSAWIDYNHNGVFDNSEYSYFAPNSGNDTIQTTISIPANALTGNVRMRVRNLAYGILYSGDACISPTGGGDKQTGAAQSYGETEDYLITIMPPDCSALSIPNGIFVTGQATVCAGQSSVLDLMPALPVANGLTYQWMSSNGGAFSNEGTVSSTASITVTPSSNTFYYCDIVCNGSSILKSDTVSITVDNISALISSTGLTCNGECAGAATVTPIGGTGSYVYSWLPGTVNASSVSGLCTGTYTAIITDANNCIATQTLVISELPALVTTSTQTNVSCFGLSDGSSSISISGGSAPLSYTWLPNGGNNSSASNLSAGTYTLNILDANNCTANQTIVITQPAMFSASIFGNSSSICEQLEDTLKSILVGGVAPFNYSWKELPSNIISTNASYEYTTSIGNHSYDLTVTDANNCSVISNTLNISVNPSSNFSGMVTTNSTTPVAGTVVLYKYLPFFTKFDSVTSQAIAPNGSFLFSSFTSGTYIIKAIPTATNMQITYGDSAINWKTAKLINHGCAVNDVQDINVKALGTFTNSGAGSLSGTIREGNGFDKRMGNSFRPNAPGSPIGGIIVKGGKNPGGQMFVQTVTDTSGYYSLQGLPENTGTESYFILVDIPGLDTNGTYDQLIINVGKNAYTNLDFIVDSAKINPVSAVSVNDISAKEHSIKIFPNPASSMVTIQYSLKEDSNVKIELFDIFGKSVLTVLNQKGQSMNQHSYSVPLENLASGMYFIKININGAESTVKLSVSQ